MGGLAAVQADQDVADDDAAVMLASGHELAHQMTDPLRRLKLWRPDVLHGIFTHWKFKVSQANSHIHFMPRQKPEAGLAACSQLTQHGALHLCCRADRVRSQARGSASRPLHATHAAPAAAAEHGACRASARVWWTT